MSEQPAEAKMPPKAIMDMAHRVKGAVGLLDPEADIELSEAGALILWNHPQLGGSMAVELRPDRNGKSAHTASLLVFCGEWQNFRDDLDELTNLFKISAKMMGGAISLREIGDGRRCITLTRTMPIEQLDPSRLDEWGQWLLWEYSVFNEKIKTTHIELP